MRFWIGVSAAFGAGTLIGIGLGTLLVEDKLKKEYKEAQRAHWRAVQAVKIDAETPVHTEEDLIHVHHRGEGVELEGGDIQKSDPGLQLVTRTPQSDNPYHVAVQHTTPSGTEIYASFAELDEEDYYEEDGREKEQIIMTFSDNVARFFMSGQEIEDAFERVGGTVVDDMRASVREGKPVIFIRNNQTDTDYEVVFEQP